MYRGAHNIHDVGRIAALNGKRKLNVYKHLDSCNVINGTDKIYFFPFQKKKDVVFVFSEDVSKSIPMRYTYKKWHRGVQTNWLAVRLPDPLVKMIC